jgi:hypothetical protein
MTNDKWMLGLRSSVSSHSWEAYAGRYAALLTVIVDRLPGEVTWWENVEHADISIDPGDTKRLTQILIDGRLRNDLGELMEGAGSYQWLTGRRVLPNGEASVLLKGGWGSDDVVLHASLNVTEPDSYSLWSYADETIADLVAGMLAAIDGDRARARDRLLHRLLTKAKAPFDVGSHVYMAAPLDDPGRFPPGARQVRCGKGYLLIVPPGATDDETLARMRWVAAAIGATD